MLKNGFTLIELIVVMTIVGLASALVLPLISSSFDRLRLNSAARQIAGLLRETRSQAISEKKTQEFSLDFDTRKYSVTIKGPEETVPVRRGELPGDVNLAGFSYAGSKELIGEGAFSVSFFSQGNSTGGNIYLGTPSDGESFSITVDKISGRVRIITIEKE